jgi:hypothetical protein
VENGGNGGFTLISLNVHYFCSILNQPIRVGLLNIGVEGSEVLGMVHSWTEGLGENANYGFRTAERE